MDVPEIANPSARRSRRGLEVAAVLLVFAVVCLPWLILLFGGVSPLTLASEGIGFRFIHPFRLQAGEPGPIFLPQGQTLGLFHHILVAIDRLGAPNNLKPLREWFDGFAFATNVLLSLLLLASLCLVLSRRASARLVAAGLLFAVYACRSGIFFVLDPDYYGLELAGTLLVIGLAVRWNDSPPTRRWRAMAGLGLLAGLLAGVKFTLAASTLLVLLPMLLAPGRGWGRRCGEGILFGCVAAAAFLGVLFAYYLGDVAALPMHFRMLATFVKQAGSEARFWPSLFTPGSPQANPGADYGYARFVLVVWLASMIAAGIVLRSAWNRKLAVTMAASLGLAALHTWGLITRPAGTTLWEACLCFLAGSICTLTELPKGTIATVVCAGASLLLASAAVIGGPQRLEQMVPLSRLQVVSRAIWQSHQELMAAPPPHVFLFLDGNHVAGTVAETLMKGCVDFPGGQLNRGRKTLNVLAGDLEISNSPSQVPAGASVLVVEAPGDRFPELEKGRGVKRWDLTVYPWWQRTVVLYSRPKSVEGSAEMKPDPALGASAR